MTYDDLERQHEAWLENMYLGYDDREYEEPEYQPEMMCDREE